eukprot:1170914-Amorphochlora_amoeboformis.AAC.2
MAVTSTLGRAVPLLALVGVFVDAQTTDKKGGGGDAPAQVYIMPMDPYNSVATIYNFTPTQH